MCTMVDNSEIIILSDDDEEEDCDNAVSCGDSSVLIVEAEDVKKNDCVLPPTALEEDLVVTFSRRAEVLPHARYDCHIHPFKATDCEVGAPVEKNNLFCDQCFCYICDKLASSCVMWIYSGVCHSNSHKKSPFWNNLRNTALLGGLKSFNLTLSEVDTHLRHADDMLQSFRQELSVHFSSYLGGISVHEYNHGLCSLQSRVHDYTKVFEFITSFLNKADKLDGRAAAVMNLGAAEDFIRHFRGSVSVQSSVSNAAEAKVILLQRVISSLQRLMLTADFTPEFIHKLQDFYNRLFFPAELKNLKNSLCVRLWDDILLVSVLKGQNVTGVRKVKGKKDVLKEQISIVLLRTEVLQKQQRYRELCRYLQVVQADNSRLLQQLQDLVPFFACMCGDFSLALHTLFPSVNAPAARLTPKRYLLYFSIFKTATAPKITVSKPDQLCDSGAAWEPLKDTRPLPLAELVRFALRAKSHSFVVSADPQCWACLLTAVNTPLPAPSPNFLQEAKTLAKSILLNISESNCSIPKIFLEVYPHQALLLLVTEALVLHIFSQALSPAYSVLSTFQNNAWALTFLWESFCAESKEVTPHTDGKTDGKTCLPFLQVLLQSILHTVYSSAGSLDQQSSSS
ncbi:uncharacterized protein zgc:112980 isoform X2 [Xyrichtys novacula]|uniref:Uncharacterized protein zgc:112980 isoform X2 n=1 Tax=Xyrichtys novacula TaxID=13765 RepID=A0AAV1EZD9_XYRNO|nr:uncharacterized protein zgc:112980 isoform X2 [Xyrichtys novacula]